MAVRKIRRYRIQNIGPQITKEEKKQMSAERNALELPVACSMISPNLRGYMAECLKRKFSFTAKNGGAVPIGLPKVSLSLDAANELRIKVCCDLDYGGVQAQVVFEENGTLGHIPFTYTTEARRLRLQETIEKRLDRMASAIRRSVPNFYPSLKHGDPEFESHFIKVTYEGFDQRMKRKEANKQLRMLTRVPPKKPGSPFLILPNLIRQAKEVLTRRSSVLRGASHGEDEVAPIGIRDVSYSFGTIANDMSFWVQVDAVVEYPPDIKESETKIRHKAIIRLPLTFAEIRDSDAAVPVLRDALMEAQSELLKRLVNSVAYQKIDSASADQQEDKMETESEGMSESEPTAGDESAEPGSEDSPPPDSDKDTTPKRKRKERTPDQSLIIKYRKKSPRHVLVAEADISRSDAMRFFSMSTAARLFKNKLVEVFKPKVEELVKDEEYRKLRQKYGEIKKELENKPKGSKEYNKLDEKRKEIGKKLEEAQEKAGVTWDLLREEHKRIRLQYPLTSVIALSAAEDVWKAIDTVLYRNGRTIHFGRYGTYPLLRAKQMDGEIIFRVVDNELRFSMNLMPTHDKRRASEASLRKAAQEKKRVKLLEQIQAKREKGESLTDEENALVSDPNYLPDLNEAEKQAVREQRNDSCWEQFEFGLVSDPTDRFLNDELARVIGFLQNPSLELAAAKRWEATQKTQDTFRPCYAALSCEKIRGKYRVFVHITIDGRPCEKFKKDGSPRHLYGVGRLGTDIGTQSVGSVSNSNVDLDNLAVRSGKSTFDSEKKQRQINQYLDRSRRESNPDNYNADKTCKKGRKTWKYSKTAKKAQKYLRNLERKNAHSREYAINQKAWEMRTEADILITEPNSAKAWMATGKAKRRHEREEAARKAAESQTVQVTVEQPQADSKQDSEPKKKKGYRRKATNKHRCPGKLMAKLKQVFESTGGKFILVDRMFRASQYDHELNQYIKKKLRDRWHVLGKTGRRVQRDVYSAFLLYCSDLDHKAPDLNRCKAKFDEFFARHEELIQNIIKRHKKICNSGI